MAKYYDVDLRPLFEKAKQAYASGATITDIVGEIGAVALEILASDGISSYQQGSLGSGDKRKTYNVMRQAGNLSRPFRPDLFEHNPEAFRAQWAVFRKSFNTEKFTVDYPDPGKVIYTCGMAFAIVIDLYYPKSRKSPGTFLEMLMGSLIADVMGSSLRKHILQNAEGIEGEEGDEIPTDIFILGDERRANLVVATKTTTRERIVQVWAHQRILDSKYGLGKYRQILVAISELRRDDKKTAVAEICVPNQVRLYQQHLARIYGVYYLDPPFGYTTQGFEAVLPVKSIDKLFTGDLKTLTDMDQG